MAYLHFNILKNNDGMPLSFLGPIFLGVRKRAVTYLEREIEIV